jgi:hypothetical protein
MVLALAPAVLAAGGCSGGEEVGLADKGGAQLLVAATEATGSFQVFVTDPREPCARASVELRATVNAVPMEVVSLGGEVSSNAAGRHCADLVLEGDIPSARGDVTIKLWDPTGQMEADFPDIFADRTTTLAEPAAEPAYVGDMLALRFSPPDPALWQLDASDNVRATGAAVAPPARTWSAHGSVQDDTVSFTVPETDVTDASPVSYDVTIAPRDQVAAARCYGVVSCTAKTAPVAGPLSLPVINLQRGDTDACATCACACADGTRASFGLTSARVVCSRAACDQVCDGKPVASATCTARLPAPQPGP